MSSCSLIKVSATANGNYEDTVSHTYRYDHGSTTTDMAAVFNGANASGPHPLPRRRERLPGTLLYAEDFSFDISAENPDWWEIQVSFKTVQAIKGGNGSTNANEYDLHPLEHSPRVTIEYLEKEYVVEQAYNLTALTGIGRSANTLGPVVNGAGQKLEDPLLDATRDPVIVISRNVGSLAEVMDLNDTYLLTTNDATISVFGHSFDARQLQYLGTDCSEQQDFENIPYWPITTRIAIRKTTDRTIESVGWKYFDAGNLVNAVDDNGDQVSEPVFITAAGALSGSSGTTPVTLGYRYLETVDYTPLLG